MPGPEDDLVDLMAECSGDPLKHVLVSYPWREKGELETYTGPDKWQIDILKAVRDGLLDISQAIQVAVSSGHGVGKLHSYETIVPTPAGTRCWGDLTPGDLVFGADGKPTAIVQTHHFQQVPMYRVGFDDGTVCDVSEGHLWNVRGRKERRRNLDGWRTLSTLDILEAGVSRPNGVSRARQWEIPIQGQVEFEPKEIDLHPYFVGLWLGDGSKGVPHVTKPYPEIPENLRQLGYDVSTSADGKTHRVRNIRHLFTDPVFSLGSSERYIPDDYKYQTVENRMALFRGLCDSDGEAHESGSIGFASTSRRLVDDAAWLARSLGCKVIEQDAVKRGWYPGEDGERVECRDCWRLTINAPFNPFSLPHRRDRYKPSEARYLTRWIDSIEPLPPADGMCITVAAADGLYLANDFIVTHNSALVAWLILWAISTFEDTKGVVTANTEVQLRTKTWPELAKWYRLFIAKHWFNFDATSISSRDPDHAKTWRIDAIAWSEKNTEAFAGLHNKGKRVIVLMDEASAIADIIFETAEGALTDADTQILWFLFGNPTRSIGRFRECWGKFRHRWLRHQIDSRTARMTNKAQISKWIDDYGVDSDFVRVRVLGVFPRVGSMQFIGQDVCDAAAARLPEASTHDPFVLGVDVARFGDDATVMVPRRGRDAQTIPWEVLRGADTMTTAARISELHAKHRFDAIFIDGGGVGGGVVDRCRMLRLPVIEVQFGGAADRSGSVDTSDGPVVYANKRAEMWGTMRDWLRGGAIPDDQELKDDLTNIQYGYKLLDGRDAIILERKDDMKKRGLASPDKGDALALTHAYHVEKSDHTATYQAQYGREPSASAGYDPYAEYR